MKEIFPHCVLLSMNWIDDVACSPSAHGDHSRWSCACNTNMKFARPNFHGRKRYPYIITMTLENPFGFAEEINESPNEDSLRKYTKTNVDNKYKHFFFCVCVCGCDLNHDLNNRILSDPLNDCQGRHCT